MAQSVAPIALRWTIAVKVAVTWLRVANAEEGVAFHADGKRTAIVLQPDLHQAIVAAGGFVARGDGTEARVGVAQAP
jgi:hypothetical protein